MTGTFDGKTRVFVFTNFDMATDYEKLMQNKGLKITYLAYGKEVCPTTKKDHHQGWICFKNACSSKRTNCARIKAKLGEKFWVAGMKGSLQANDKYCSKEGQLTEFGNRPAQGSRADLGDIIKRISEGETTSEDICLTDPGYYHQYGRTIQKAEDIVKRGMVRMEMTQGIWIWGATGTGKSHMAFTGFDIRTHYVKPVLDDWWDGYTGQETVIINDYRGQIPYSELLNLVDKWPHYVKRRCREPTPFVAKRLIITSSVEPRDVYTNLHAKDQLAQLYRRFEIICTDPKPEDGGLEPEHQGASELEPEHQGASELELAQKYSEGNKRTSEPRSWAEFTEAKKRKV